MGKKFRVYRGRTASVVGMTAAFLVVSICLYTLQFARGSLQGAMGEAHLSVMVVDESGIDPATTARWIESIEGVKAAKYVDSTDAQREFSSYLGVDLTSVLGEGAIPSSYVVTIDATSGGRREIEKIKQQISAVSWAESVSYEEVIVERLDVMSARIDQFAKWLVGLIIALILVFLYVVDRLAVGVVANAMPDAPCRYLRRESINRAVVDSAVAGVASAVLTAGGLYVADALCPTLALPFDTLPLIACVVLVVGFAVNLLFTYISTLQR